MKALSIVLVVFVLIAGLIGQAIINANLDGIDLD